MFLFVNYYPAMTSDQILKHSAFAYLNQWHRSDGELLAKIIDADVDSRGVAFASLAVKYSVIRTFPIKAIREKFGEAEVAERWKHVATAVRRVKIDSATSPTDKVNRLAKKLWSIFSDVQNPRPPQNLISAASKFLWFDGNPSIRIYDTRAVIALNRLQEERKKASGISFNKINGNYGNYVEAWEEESTAHDALVKAAIRGVGQCLDYSAIPDGEARRLALRASKTEWFRDRVFDRFLWTIGEDSAKAASSAEKLEILKKVLSDLEQR